MKVLDSIQVTVSLASVLLTLLRLQHTSLCVGLHSLHWIQAKDVNYGTFEVLKNQIFERENISWRDTSVYHTLKIRGTGLQWSCHSNTLARKSYMYTFPYLLDWNGEMKVEVDRAWPLKEGKKKPNYYESQKHRAIQERVQENECLESVKQTLGRFEDCAVPKTQGKPTVESGFFKRSLYSPSKKKISLQD